MSDVQPAPEQRVDPAANVADVKWFKRFPQGETQYRRASALDHSFQLRAFMPAKYPNGGATTYVAPPTSESGDVSE